MTTKQLTCVVCPAGCRMTVTLDENGSVQKVEGNTCIRGKNYAESEITHPVRTLTSTVAVTIAGGKKMLPVRTNKPIPKESLFAAMKIINSLTVSAPDEISRISDTSFIIVCGVIPCFSL